MFHKMAQSEVEFEMHDLIAGHQEKTTVGANQNLLITAVAIFILRVVSRILKDIFNVLSIAATSQPY